MTTKYKNAQHAEVSATPRPRMHTRFGKALIAGCLALSLCPAVAYAAQPGQGGPQQGGNPPMMQQAENNGPASQQGSNQEGPQQGGNPPAAPSQDGNAPDAPSQDGNAPDMQQPNGQRPGDDAVSGQVRQILTDEYELNTTPPTDDNQQPGQPGQPALQVKPPSFPKALPTSSRSSTAHATFCAILPLTNLSRISPTAISSPR